MDDRPSLERVTFRNVCPQCGKAGIFKRFITMHERCTSCGLHFAAREQGDGPAFFGIVIMGTLATIGAGVTEVLYSPPYWLHAVLWLPFVVIGSLVCLRFAKAFMLGLQYGANPGDFS